MRCVCRVCGDSYFGALNCPVSAGAGDFCSGECRLGEAGAAFAAMPLTC